MSSKIDLPFSAIALMDTSILLELLCVPYKSSEDESQIIEEDFRNKVANKEKFFLPLVTIFETGNHIAQIKPPYTQYKYEIAKKFIDMVESSARGDAPFALLNFIRATEIHSWIKNFPNVVSRMGLGDLSIIQDQEQLKLNYPQKRIYIWSKDGDFDNYEACIRKRK